jgi:hypothetical protein
MNVKLISVVADFLMAGAVVFSEPAQAEAKARPNILWLFSDDHAYQAIGAYGDRFADMNLTPNLDSITAQSMRFDKCYVGNSICAPSRATLLTGKIQLSGTRCRGLITGRCFRGRVNTRTPNL